MEIKAESVNEAFHLILDCLNTNGALSAPRGMIIREVLNCCIEIENPRDRIVNCPERNISMAYAFGELCWYLAGRNDLKMMDYYSKFMKRGTDDGVTLNSAYGYRIFKGEHPLIPFDQWENVKRLLKEDKNSRQAIIHLHTPNNKKTNDEVCTLSLQFLIRDDKLNMITTMRSNDIFLGFTYDAFAFTMLQEILANELGLELGKYYHNAGSMHIYENKFSLLKKHTQIKLAPMDRFRYGLEGFDKIINLEENIRTRCVKESEELSGENKLETMSRISTDVLNEIEENNEDSLFKFASIALLLKAAKYLKVENQSRSSNWLGVLRDKNESYADVLQCLGGFSKGKRKIIVEGMDGAGKTSYVLEKQKEGLYGKYQIQHYVKPSNGFEYYENYLLNLENDFDIIFDRFFVSELVYSKVFEREGNLTAAQKDILVSICRERCEFVFLIAENEEQLNVAANRLKLEDLTLKDRLKQLNEAYIEVAKYLCDEGCSVKIRGVQEGGML